MNVLILLENPCLTLNVMRCLDDAGAHCHVFGAGANQPIRLSKYCRNYVRQPKGFLSEGVPELIDQINRYILRHHIDCIVPGDFQSAVFIAKFSSRFETKTAAVAESHILETLANKWTFSQLLKAQNLPQPQTFLAVNMEQYEAIPLAFPRVVKPLEGGGRWTTSRDNPGSYVINDHDRYIACAQNGNAFPLLIQEYIPGIDVGLNIFALQGRIKAYTMQEFIGNERLKFFDSPELLALGERLAAVTNFQGVANIDIRIDQRDNQFRIIECNPRFWGSLRASRWNGVNFPVICLHSALGKEISHQVQNHHIEYVFPSRVLLKIFKGKLSALNNLPEATRKDLAQIICDPLSCLYSVLNRN